MEERIRSMRIAFITDKLALTPEESQNFWPVYNEFTGALTELKDSAKKPESFDDMSDDEAVAFLDHSISVEKQAIALKQNYINQLKDLIPVQKIAKLHMIEMEFKKEMLNQVKRRSDRKPKRNK
jgi:hypothetical protein